MRHAMALVKAAAQFQSTVLLKCGDKIADLRSFLSVVALCASMGTVLEVEITGADEVEARQVVVQVFQP